MFARQITRLYNPRTFFVSSSFFLRVIQIVRKVGWAKNKPERNPCFANEKADQFFGYAVLTTQDTCSALQKTSYKIVSGRRANNNNKEQPRMSTHTLKRGPIPHITTARRSPDDNAILKITFLNDWN
jgi:hypothetical protein